MNDSFYISRSFNGKGENRHLEFIELELNRLQRESEELKKTIDNQKADYYALLLNKREKEPEPTDVPVYRTINPSYGGRTSGIDTIKRIVQNRNIGLRPRV